MLYGVCSGHSSRISFKRPSFSNSRRAFGDKTNPPVIPFTNSAAQVETEECEEGRKAEGQVSDGQDNPEPNAVETSCQGMQELRLTDQDSEALKDKEPVEEGEDIDGEESDSRSPQGEIFDCTWICRLTTITYVNIYVCLYRADGCVIAPVLSSCT